MQSKIVVILFVFFVAITISFHPSAASAKIFSPQSKIPTYIEQKIFKSNTVIIYPIFTQAAYGKGGFYDYYRKQCDTSCLTVPIPLKIFLSYVASGQGYLLLSSLGFDSITDVDVDKNPSILKEYKNIIVLHNEYVTKKEFNAIVHCPNVIYMYPNALYAEVRTNYDNNTISLLNGHGYPLPSISNGFDWKFDNSRYEYNTACSGWNFYRTANGWMLNCYPELVASSDKTLQSSLIERIQ